MFVEMDYLMLDNNVMIETTLMVMVVHPLVLLNLVSIVLQLLLFHLLYVLNNQLFHLLEWLPLKSSSTPILFMSFFYLTLPSLLLTIKK